MPSEVDQKTKRTEDEILDELAELLADNFQARKAVGTPPKPLKRAKQSVRK